MDSGERHFWGRTRLRPNLKPGISNLGPDVIIFLPGTTHIWAFKPAPVDIDARQCLPPSGPFPTLWQHATSFVLSFVAECLDVRQVLHRISLGGDLIPFLSGVGLPCPKNRRNEIVQII